MYKATLSIHPASPSPFTSAPPSSPPILPSNSTPAYPPYSVPYSVDLMTPSRAPSYPFIIRPSVPSVLVTLSREMSVSQVVGAAVPSAGSREPGAGSREPGGAKAERREGGEGLIR
jgi:hypothetical protein